MYNVKSHVNGDFQNGRYKCTIEIDYNVKSFYSQYPINPFNSKIITLYSEWESIIVAFWRSHVANYFQINKKLFLGWKVFSSVLVKSKFHSFLEFHGRRILNGSDSSLCIQYKTNIDVKSS